MLSNIQAHNYRSQVTSTNIKGAARKNLDSVSSTKDTANEILLKGTEFIKSHTGSTKELVSAIMKNFSHPAADDSTSFGNASIAARIGKLLQAAYVSRGPSSKVWN